MKRLTHLRALMTWSSSQLFWHPLRALRERPSGTKSASLTLSNIKPRHDVLGRNQGCHFFYMGPPLRWTLVSALRYAQRHKDLFRIKTKRQKRASLRSETYRQKMKVKTLKPKSSCRVWVFWSCLSFLVPRHYNERIRTGQLSFVGLSHNDECHTI